MYRTGQAVLEEALAFYQELLPNEGNDPRMRREAVQLFGQVAEIHHTLDQATKAAEAWARQASLLKSLLEEEPASKDLRIRLADAHRWRGNAPRDLGNVREAREAYDQAASIQEALCRESPDEPLCQMALSNTLLNTASILSNLAHGDELERLYRRVIELDRAAVHTAPDNQPFNAELALRWETRESSSSRPGRPPRPRPRCVKRSRSTKGYSPAASSKVESNGTRRAVSPILDAFSSRRARCRRRSNPIGEP